MRSRSPSSLAVGLVVLLGVAPAAAERASGARLLGQAIEAYEDLRVEAALDLLGRAEAAGRLAPDDLVRLHLYRGLARAALGQPEADGSFRNALAIDPEIAAPPATSPVVVRRLEALRRELSGEAPVGDPDPGSSGDPGDGGAGGEGPGDGAGPGDPPPPPPPPPQERRLLLTWVGTGLSGAALLGGLTATLLAEITRATLGEREHDQSWVDEQVDAYRLRSRVAVGLLSTAVALGVTTLIAWLGERPAAASPTLAPGPGGAGLALTAPLAF